jgi:hypothetical protein
MGLSKTVGASYSVTPLRVSNPAKHEGALGEWSFGPIVMLDRGAQIAMCEQVAGNADPIRGACQGRPSPRSCSIAWAIPHRRAAHVDKPAEMNLFLLPACLRPCCRAAKSQTEVQAAGLSSSRPPLRATREAQRTRRGLACPAAARGATRTHRPFVRDVQSTLSECIVSASGRSHER